MNEDNKHLVSQIFEWLNFSDDIIDLLEFIGDLQEWVEAVLRALGGNFGPLSALVSELIENAPPRWAWIGNLANWNPIGDLIAGLQTMLNQIGEIVRGVIVTPINNMVSNFKDWFLGLVGWQSNTSNKHQELTNMVWQGATTQPIEENLTEQQVKDAVAALKARSEALQRENELRYSTAVPLWQGLIPGGDVTCDVNTVSVRDNWNIAVSGSSGGTAAHTHSAGSYSVDLALGNVSAITANADTAYVGPFATFRARSDVGRNVGTFLARGLGSLTDARLSLWTYDYENDRWMCVLVSNNFVSQVGLDYGWVDATFPEEYTPSVGELMGVMWTASGTGNMMVACSFGSGDAIGNWAIPKYHSVPYGTTVNVGLTSAPARGLTVTLNSSQPWRIGRTPFCQIAPDLGQVVTPPPQYWFDDFNTNNSAAYTLGGGAKLKNGQFAYNGGGDGVQYIIYKGQMATDKMAVEATISGTGVPTNQLRMHCTTNGTSGVSLVINGTGTGNNSAMLTYVSASNPAGLTEVKRASDNPNTYGPGRWRIEFDPDTVTYTITKGGNFILDWADPTNLAQRGKGKRTGGLGIQHALFLNGGTWDDLLIYDIDQEVE
ncbi:minor tail protein [Gordonia phage BrutonGaster]|uniref:Minor tail protein n=1 Tax=Gordonia phage BrutonGaster TaxID=2530116 RepID=A0A482JKF4_9CAUD|nr:minor tail protein [Gordonia phage BrutonGaster]QBP33262.1 minor tail protein [Gordonia phage BrutonGaster]